MTDKPTRQELCALETFQPNVAAYLRRVEAERDALATELRAAAVALGRRGGLKGGPARARALSPARRKALASKAAKARWGKKGKP